MQDDEMDIRIREAANQHHPPYDDKAWEKMEQLLDKHMPQQKDKRRWLPFLLLFLLVGGSALLLMEKPWKKDAPALAQNTAASNSASGNTAPNSTPNIEGKNAPSQSVAGSNTGNSPVNNATGNNPSNAGARNGQTTVSNAPDGTTMQSGINNPDKQTTQKDPVATNSNSTQAYKQRQSNALFTVIGADNKTNSRKNKSSAQTTGKTDPSLAAANGKKNLKDKSRLATQVNTPDAVSDDNMAETKNETVLKPADKDKAKDKENKQVSSPVGEELSKMTTAIEAVKTDKKTVTPADKAKEAATAGVTNTKDKKKTSRGFGNNFAISLSTGLDASFINIKNPGKVTLLYGGGLSYNISKRFTVRSGFYVSRKIYTATPAQYNNVIYPNLTEVEANCKIYQIPVSVSYNFGQRKNHSWFGNAGLTSLIMKKEDYLYDYKTPTGQTYYYNRSISNENKHYFSVLSLSAGYQRNLGNRVSIVAEPFVNLPLKGIGFGKIKLNSGGVMLSVAVKPFAKKKN